MHSLVVQFDPTRWGAELLRLPEFARIADLFKRAGRGLRFGGSVGFGNLSNFNRSFRIARGMAPGEFRRQALAPPPDRAGRRRS